MNKNAAAQLHTINAYIINNKEPLSDVMPNNLSSVSAVPFQQNYSLYFYYIYKTLAAKAAKLGCEIANTKPFENGNEVTAAVAALTMLEINGLKPVNYLRDIDGLYQCFSENDIGKAEAWINSHVV